MSEISQEKKSSWDALVMNDVASRDDLAALLNLSLELDLSSTDQNKRSLLHLFCHYKALKCATYVFLTNPCLTKQKDVMDEIPLHRACYGKNISNLLLDAILPHSDTNAKNVFGATCLHYASLMGTEEVFDFLVSRGADPNIADKQGLLPKKPKKIDV